MSIATGFDAKAVVVPEIVDGISGVRDYALDPDAARRLWDISLDLLTKARSGA